MVIIRMRCSIEPRDRIYVKGYGFLSFTKNLSNKFSQKLLDSAKKSITDATKTEYKRAIQKTAEVTGDLIGNKIEDKIPSVSKSPSKLHSENNLEEAENEIEIPKERYLYIRETENY